MDRLHARYPFLASARAAVEHADVELAAVIEAERSPIVERAVERIEGAIHDGRVPDPIATVRVELLSYPVARVLVSLVDDPVLTDRYALAEARRAFALLADEVEDRPRLRSTENERLTRADLLEEFDLADRVAGNGETYELDVTAYLSLSGELRGREWRLVGRGLADGSVPVSGTELDRLVREAIRLRVAADLPLDVPEEVSAGLADRVAEIRATTADLALPGDVDAVEPAAFPTCIAEPYERMRGGEDVSPVARFTVVSFLACIGAAPEELIEAFGAPSASDEQLLRYQHDHLHGETRSTAYPPPSCATLETYGICQQDGACAEAGHPLVAYADRLRAAGDQSS